MLLNPIKSSRVSVKEINFDKSSIMEIIKSVIIRFILNFEYIITQSTVPILNVLSKRRCLNEVTLHFLNVAPPNHLFDIGFALQCKRQKIIWMKKRSSDWWERIVNNNDYFKEEDWLETFRMTKPTFQWLCDELRDELIPKENQLGFREPLSVEKQVAVCLYFLASCCEYRVVGNIFGIHKSTVWKCVHKVVNAINAKLMHMITMPDDNECQQIAAGFEKKTNLPQIIGAIDGTHIPILPPSDGYRDFINRKGWPSIILQAVVDDNMRFRNIFCGTPGASHDAAVFQSSNLYKNSNLLIPQRNSIISNVSIPYFIVGDPAYPLLPWLIKGYTKSNRLTAEEDNFNVCLNSGRVYIEIAFGRLKARWRRLLKRMDIHYSYTSHIISACCLLHNIVEERKEKFLPAWECLINQSNIETQQPQAFVTRNLDDINASTIRDTLKIYLAENFALRSF